VRRLSADPRREEEQYFAETGVFPVMHVVVLGREVYEQRLISREREPAELFAPETREAYA
jgi:hypothetical protein